MSRDLYERVAAMATGDRSAGRRWRANKLLGEFESGFVGESVFVACARKLLKVPHPDDVTD